ncbi:hypothetical protein [Pseudoalteromonas sp.]|uniref:hypothetical protein n=1 Tax=Pseudoalteromonas sp. TaxID=53249 RepID=UPI00356AEB5D
MGNSPNPFIAKWSAEGHTLCLGHWQISYKGLPIRLQEKQKVNDMGTYGVYDPIFDNDPEFSEGLEEDDWILANLDWLSKVFFKHHIPCDEAHCRWFYQAVDKADWRCGSCGGCM